MSNQRRPDCLVFRPGQGLPAIQSNRVPLAGTLLRGRPAQTAPQRLPLLYALCGEAHRLTAQLAIDAAMGGRTEASHAELSCLETETAREHVRRIWLDWPRLLCASDHPPSATAVQSLWDCPLLRRKAGKETGKTSGQAAAGEGAASRTRTWVERHVLGQPVAGWLTQWQADPDACLHDWVRRATTLPAELLRGIEGEACRMQPRAAPLLVHADRQALRALAQQIAASEEFAFRPASAGHLCETGSWTRLSRRNGNTPVDSSAWLRFGARIAELACLSTDTPDVLALGAMTLAPGEAIAWCEMARGLLLHWVKLDLAGSKANIVDYRVVAPTEWNFHPSGVVAQALAGMPPATDPVAQTQATLRAGILAAAFDPCVPFNIVF